MDIDRSMNASSTKDNKFAGAAKTLSYFVHDIVVVKGNPFYGFHPNLRSVSQNSLVQPPARSVLDEVVLGRDGDWPRRSRRMKPTFP